MGALALGVATRAVVPRAKRADALATRRDVGARGAIGGVRRERVREGATRAVVSALEVDERAASRAERPRAHDAHTMGRSGCCGEREGREKGGDGERARARQCRVRLEDPAGRGARHAAGR